MWLKLKFKKIKKKNRILQIPDFTKAVENQFFLCKTNEHKSKGIGGYQRSEFGWIPVTNHNN